MTVLQIQSFVQSLVLDKVAPVKESQESSSAPTEKTKVKKEATKGRKETKTTVIERGAEPLDKVDKKKRKEKESKASKAAEASVSGGGGDGGSGELMMDEGVNRKLVHLSVKSYKKLLVSMDNEEMWYDQVSYMYMYVYCNIKITLTHMYGTTLSMAGIYFEVESRGIAHSTG